jgi:hypothetical protein
MLDFLCQKPFQCIKSLLMGSTSWCRTRRSVPPLLPATLDGVATQLPNRRQHLNDIGIDRTWLRRHSVISTTRFRAEDSMTTKTRESTSFPVPRPANTQPSEGKLSGPCVSQSCWGAFYSCRTSTVTKECARSQPRPTSSTGLVYVLGMSSACIV